MSLYGALNIGVAGLSANSQALSATASNIANVNTVGYKEATASFSTFLNATTGVGNNSSAGVACSVGQDITTQGLPTTTSSDTDLSISGNGFFVVAPNPDGSGPREYTRAGSFSPDVNGNLVNAAGLYLMGYKLDASGNVPTDASALSLVNTTSISGAAQATSNLSVQANLNATSTVDAGYTAGDMTSGTVAPDFTRTVNVFDSQGGSQPITFSFIKTAANTWAYEASYAGAASNLTATGPISEGTIAFNSDGTLANVNGASPASGTISLTVPWDVTTSGLQPQTISLNLGSVGGSDGLTQADAPSVLVGTNIDGTPYGSVTGVTVAKDGTVTAQFSNGLSQDVYKIPLATFTNPNGLGQITGNAYLVTKASGAPNINLAQSGPAGFIQSKSLEGSTVDLATEFTNLITTQRAYSASARIITTADQMLQQLEQLPTN
ncbi:MAG TPA: flagellar hook protein FlgE [Rhizomicrobium sp.]|jgi:flagellar hook protein FlgE|nr:flagellar hook protein FlgE [Rhizomicrobium sp.]